MFLNSVLNFLIVSLVIFLLVQQVNQFEKLSHSHVTGAKSSTQKCRFCASKIPVEAICCPQCTSALQVIQPEANGDKPSRQSPETATRV